MTELNDLEQEHHTPETTIQEEVADYFQNQPEVEHVEREVYQSDPYWFVDVIVEYPWATLCIECENDWDSVRPGIGQAIGYAGDPSYNSSVPMVVFPSDHVDTTELRRFQRSGVLVRAFDREEGGFVDV